MPPEEWRDHLEALAMSFTPMANMVASSKCWMSVHVLPALHAQLVQGTAAMGHTMQSLFEMSSLVGNPQARAVLTVSEIALAMKEGSGSAAARSAAPDGARVNQAVLEAAEELGRDTEAMEQVRRLGQLASAAAKNEAEAPALRAAAKAAATSDHGADISLLIHQEKLDPPRHGTHCTTRTVRRWGAH